MAEMRSLLAFMDADDRAHVLRFYEMLFDQAGEAGESALLKKLGSPVRQVLQVEKLYRDKQKAEEASFGVEPAEAAVASAEESADMPEEAASEETPETGGNADAFLFAVPREEDAVDFGAEEEPEEEIQPEEEPVGEEEPAEEQPAAETVTEAAAEEAEPAAEPEEQPETEEEEPSEPAEEAETPSEAEEHTEDESGEEPEEETGDEAAQEEEKKPVSAGRVVAAVFVTIPMILLVLLGLALSLSLGFTAIGIGAVMGAAGGYLSGYAFGGVTAFLPDILLLAGGMLLCFCLALFFLWLGIWLAVGGVRLTIRIVAAVYRGILKRGGQTHE